MSALFTLTMITIDFFQCSLIKSNFNDQIVLGISKNLSIISFDYVPQTYQCDATLKIDSAEFKTMISTILPSVGVAYVFDPHGLIVDSNFALLVGKK